MKRFIGILIAGAILFSFSSGVVAQTVDQKEVQDITEKYDLSVGKPPEVPLFDLSRLNLKHSYSVSFFSGSGYSGTIATYTGSLLYQLHRNLNLRFNVDVLHEPGALFDQTQSSDVTLIPSGTLDWRPSENFRMSIGFTHYPEMDYSLLRHYFYDRYGRYSHFRR
jgi:hypothetical protein